VSFQRKPDRDRIVETWKSWEGRPQALGLPSAPRPFLRYFAEDERPQTRLDRDAGPCPDDPKSARTAGMAITIGRLREDKLLDYRFVCLSHNTIRGAAGGAILTAELLKAEGYLTAK
jgi:aspartate-semialdehyde dehydrogenase